MKKSKENTSRTKALFTWVFILWGDFMTLRWNDRSWRALGVRLLGMGCACMLCGVLLLGEGIVTMQSRAWIFGAIVLGVGLFAFLIGLLYRSSQ
jgi:multisubunit Na+/H+ antiporter MnhC subunit